MYLKRLSLINFKNIEHAELDLSQGINGLVGDNGAGKSNVLDAIHLLSMSKSMLPITDGQCIKHSADFYMLEGDYARDDERRERISCSYSTQRSQARGGKIVKCDGKEYERLSDHVGRIPIVVVTPYDSALISDSAEERRRFLNLLISQYDVAYLSALIRYNALLAQRNKLLKVGGGEEQMLIIYDEQMAQYSQTIEEKRRATIERITPLLTDYYEKISGNREQVSVELKSQLCEGDNFLEAMAAARERDRVNGYTTVGPHRDDVVFKINDYLLRKFGSQGQQKSFLIALKLAQYQLYREQKGECPILLLDDLFDKLDRSRVEQLIHLVASEDFGQIIISDCNRERLKNILDKAEVDYSLYTVDGGAVAKNT